jgi:hypothetical protein
VQFEMTWCNFSSPSIKLVSHLNITAPFVPPTGDDTKTREDGDEWVELEHRGENVTSYRILSPSSGSDKDSSCNGSHGSTNTSKLVTQLGS